MAAVATFDTLKFANTLKAAGVPDKQAEAQAVAFAEVNQLNFKDLATKDDLAAGGKGQQAALDAAVKDLRREIAETKEELKREFKEETHKLHVAGTKLAGELALIKWMLGATLTGVLGLVVRLFFFRTP